MGDVDIAGYAHFEVDRFAVLLDVWSNEMSFMQCKKEVCSLQHSNGSFYSILVGERSIVISLSVWVSVYLSVCLCICLSVCLSVREHISGTAGPIFTKLSMQIPCGHGSAFLWRLCDTLCTSGFIDDVMFGHNGPYGNVWKAHPQPTTASNVAILGQSLMSKNALFVLSALQQ